MFTQSNTCKLTAENYKPGLDAFYDILPGHGSWLREALIRLLTILRMLVCTSV